MATMHKIRFGSALVALTGLAHAQSTMPAPAAIPAGPTDNSSGGIAPGAGSTSSGAGATVTNNPTTSASNDPYVQRREARKQTKAEY